MKKLIVRAELLLHEDEFEAAKLLAGMENHIKALRKPFTDLGGKVEHAIVSVRGPNKKPVPLHPMAVVHGSADDAA